MVSSAKYYKKVMEAEIENRPLYIEIRSSVVTSKNEASVEHSGWKPGCNTSNRCVGR